MPRHLPGDETLRIRMAALGPLRRARFLARLDPPELDAIDDGWGLWGHEGQHAPPAEWRTWVIMAGRGFGKTRAGAEWVKAFMNAQPGARIALVAATLEEARRVMIDGPSGLIEVAGDAIENFYPSLRLLRFTNGAEATLFSGASPESLRGPEHHAAWCDELAKWQKPGQTWDMLQMGLRLGDRPRALVTTTPRSGPTLRRIIAAKGTVQTGGPTTANPHLPEAFVEAVTDQYAGTRLGRQELDGELLPDVDGALWSVDLIERCRIGEGMAFPARPERSAQRAVEGRVSPASEPRPSTTACGLRSGRADGLDGAEIARPERSAQRAVEGRSLSSSEPRPSTSPGTSGEGDRTSNTVRAEPVEALPSLSNAGKKEGSPSTSSGRTVPYGQRWAKVVIGVDPPASTGTCGIIACAQDANGIAHVLADHSVTNRAPEAWARAVAAAAEVHRATLIIAERNQGGDMVRAVLRAADSRLPIRLVHAAQGKSARAEPVHALFEAGKVVLHGRFPELEAELCGIIAGGGYEPVAWPGPGGPGPSPDRADAMVWALTELMLGERSAEPRVVGF